MAENNKEPPSNTAAGEATGENAPDTSTVTNEIPASTTTITNDSKTSEAAATADTPCATGQDNTKGKPARSMSITPPVRPIAILSPSREASTSKNSSASISPEKPWADPPPTLIEKISLADESSPSSGQQQHEERPSSEAKQVQSSLPSEKDHLTSGVTKAAGLALQAPLSSDSKQHLESETVKLHGKSQTISAPPSASGSHASADIVSNTSLPAISRMVMPYGLTNDAGQALSPPTATQMASTSRSMGLPASPSFTRSEGLHLDNQSHHRPSIDHSGLPTLPPPSGLGTRPRSSRSPSGARSPPLSDSSDSSIHLLPPLAMDSSASSAGHQATGPPLLDTDVLQKIVTPDGHIIRPEIHARIDKGFFLSDNDWTCYRRNYFSVGCSYSLYPPPNSPLYLQRHVSVEPINGFAIKISAAVEGAGGKPVELVQHTPKRDKGPQMQPGFIKLVPQSATNTQLPGGGLPPSLLRHGSEYDYNYPHSHMAAHQPLNQAVYDRIQFKSATANNGKRRAAQQYYHLVVELYAEVVNPNSTDPDGSYVMVAKRVSAPMVVRGRSPGHYVDERKHRPASAGPDGRGSGTQPSTPATAYAPPSGLPADHVYYTKATLPGVAPDQEHYGHLPSESEQATYAYYPQTLNHGYDARSNHGPYAGYYISGGVHDFKGYQPVGISCGTYGDSTYGYIPSNGRSRVKHESTYNNLAWPRETPRAAEYPRNHIPDKFYSTDSSSQHYPSLPTL